MLHRRSFISIFKAPSYKELFKQGASFLLFVMLGIGGAAAVAEIGLRVLGYGCVSYLGYGPLQNALDIPEIGYGGRPNIEGVQSREGFNQLKFNSLGFHDIEHVSARSLHTKQIAVFGNSFTMCAQVPLENCYVRRLEREMNSCLGKEKVETINYGVDGYSLEQTFLLMRKILTEKQPDIILLQVALYPFNSEIDMDSRKAPEITFTGDGQAIVKAPFLERWSYKVRASWIYALYQAASDHLRLLQYLNEYRRVSFVDKSNKDYSKPEALEHYWQTRFSVLEGIVKMAEEKKIPLFLVLTPAAGEKETGGEPDIEKEGAVKWISEASRLNTPVLDVRNDFHTRSFKENTYYFGFGHESGRGHLNAYGQAAFAKLLSTNLCPLLSK